MKPYFQKMAKIQNHKWRISVKRRNPFQNQLPDIQAKKQYLIRATEKSPKNQTNNM